MDSKTKQALEESIIHWQENLHHAKEGTLDLIEMGGEYCALCNYILPRGGNCNECPVMERSGDEGCIETPWVKASSTFLKARNSLYTKALRQGLINAIQDELDFLISLREEK